MTTAKKGGLFGDVRKTLFGNLVFSIAQWVVLIVVARLGSAEQVGYITLATAIATPVFALTGLSLRDARAVDVGPVRSDQDYLRLRVLLSMAAVILAAVIIVGKYGDATWALIFVISAVVLTRIPHMQSTLHYGIAQTRGRFDVVVKSQVLRGVLGALCFAVTFAVTGSVGSGFVAQALCWIAIIVVAERRALAQDGVDFDIGPFGRANLQQAFGLMLWMMPMSIAGALQMISLYVPRLVLAEFVTFEALGLFGAIYYFLTAIQTLAIGISQASVSRMAKAAATGNAPLLRRITALVMGANLALGLAIVVGALTVGEWLVGAVYGAAYVDRFLIVMVAVTAALQLVMGVTQYALLAGHHFALRLWINLICLIAAFAFSFWMIPDGGAVGAAWAILWVVVVRLSLGLLVLGWMLSRPLVPAGEGRA